MRLSLVNRVILGFAVVTLLLLTIAASGYLSQIRMAQQLELTASTLTGLLDRANTTLMHLQDANRHMMQHANTENAEDRERLRTEFEDSKTDYQEEASLLISELENFPAILETVNQAGPIARTLLSLAEEHLNIQDERIQARNRSFTELDNFEGEFIFFQDDIAYLIESAENAGQQQTIWDLDFILDQAEGAQIYLQRMLAVTEPEAIESARQELFGYLTRINEKVTNIERDMPSLIDDIQVYQDVLTQAIADPEGTFQQHLRYVDLNRQSNELLSEAASLMEQLSDQLGHSVSLVRQASASARADAENTFENSLTINITLALASIVIAVFIAWTVTRAIKVPLSEIMAALARLSDGNLSQPIQSRFHSEMGMVANNVNILREQLGQLIAEIQQSAQTISDVAEESYQMSDQTNRDVALQREQTDSVATAVTEMEAAIQEVATHAADASDEVSKVSDEAQQSMENMGKNLRFVSRLKESLDNASSVIQQLSEESQQIGDILNVIQGIAEQTNLLALNAAIEAARAGEQGRGFAVVADEVRSLANRTQQSANEIRDMIESLQGKASQAVTIVEGNLEHADRSVQQTQETNEALNQMVARLANVNDMSRSIATASEEQSAVAKDVAQNVVQISDMSENIAKRAESSADNSQSLNDLSTDQKNLISRFRL